MRSPQSQQSQHTVNSVADPPPVLDERRGPKFNNWVVLAVAALLIGVGGLTAIILIRKFAVQPTNMFGVVVDAGSTSSKIYVYRWPSYRLYGNGVVNETDSGKTSTGIDGVGGIQQMTNMVNKLAKDGVPSDLFKSTELFLGATAGMRMLKDRDPARNDAIFSEVRSALSATKLKFSPPEDKARIITGTEEAVDGWVTVNYLKGVFGKMDPSSYRITYNSFPTETFGSLDLGGASTQIAFQSATNASTAAAAAGVSNLRLYSKNYPVYGHSFLCYGKSQAELRLLAILARDQFFSASLKNPCAPAGNSTVHTAADFLNAPCTRGPHARQSYGFDITVPNNITDNTQFTFTGTSDHKKCLEKVQEFFNNTCTTPPCSFNNVHQPKPSGKFLAFAGFYYILSFFNQTGSNADTLQNFKTSVETYCSKKWTEVQGHKAVSSKFLIWYCFDGIYVWNLLAGYGFKTEEQWQKLSFVNKVSDTTVGWSLGYMIQRTGLIPSEKPLLSIGDVPFGLLVVLFLLFIIMALAFAVLAYRRRDAGFRSNSPGSPTAGYGAL